MSSPSPSITAHGGAAGSRRLALALGLIALAALGAEVASRYAPHTWIQRDGRFYVNVNTTLVESASFDQGEFCRSWYERDLVWNRELDVGWSNVSEGAHGERLPKHPVLMPLASTPLFWAFGLHGTLLFNLLMLALAAGAAFLFARAYTGRGGGGALAAALALILGTGLRDYAYDYHIDVMLLAVLLSAIVSLKAGRGLLAGLLTGAAVVIKPTTLLLLPALSLLALRTQRERRALLLALLGGAAVLLLFALTNWHFFGKPWWSAYNRVLVRVGGQTQIADVSDAFSTPFKIGLWRLWGGTYGLRTKFPLFALALPGLLLLLRERPLYVLAACLGLTTSVILFAHYRWEGDRFLWPALSLLLPALARSLDMLGRALVDRFPLGRRRRRPSPARLAGLAALLMTLAGGLAGPPIEAQIPDGAYASLPLLSSLAEALRAAAGREGLYALGLLWAGLYAYGAARLLARFGGEALGALIALAALLLPGLRERFVAGGPEPVAAALAFALLGVALGGAPHRWARRRRGAWPALLGLLAVGLAGLPLAPEGVEPRPLPLLAELAAALGAGLLLERLARALLGGIRALRRRGRWALWAPALLALSALALFGGARRFARARAPLELASERGVREAQVRLGEVPCDLLVWEHLSWECARLDSGIHNMVGLASDLPAAVGGQKRELLLVPTGRRQVREVRWEDVEAEQTLRLRWAVPDGERGGGRLEIRVGDRLLHTLEVPERPTGELRELRLDTSAFAGQAVELTLRHLPPTGSPGPSVVALRGGFISS